MSRPTSVQLTYGSVTVILSTVAMLLLTQTQAVYGIALITVVALALGLLVALNTPVRPSATAAPAQSSPSPRSDRARPAESRAHTPSLR